VRRGLISVAAGLLIACASASPPPGGPEDHAPPQLLKITPDTNALNVTDKVVTFTFDETINDRGSGQQELVNYFLVSPSDGEPRIDWHRSRIDVRPRRGFRPNTAYTVSLLPGLTDLRNNAMKTGATVVFSTGATIPTLRLTGTVFDWATERPAVKAFVQAVTPDSIIYLAQTDTLGQFVLGPLPAGSYLVRGIIDQNGNRALDRNEPYDSARVTAPHPEAIELLAIQRDTLPPRLVTVTLGDSMSLRVTFDRVLDPTATLKPESFRLVASDSSVVPILAVLTPREESERAASAQKTTADSVRRADSLAGKPLRAVVPPTPAVPVRVRGAAAVPAPKPSVPPPSASVVLRLPRPLRPNSTYRLSVTDARSLSGRTQSSERSFSTPKPPPPPPPDTTRKTPGTVRDTTRKTPAAASDTTRRPPAAAATDSTRKPPSRP
jgi:hypothetical protein